MGFFHPHLSSGSLVSTNFSHSPLITLMRCIFATAIHIFSAKSCVMYERSICFFHFRYCHCNTGENIESALYHILNAKIKDKLVSTRKNRQAHKHTQTFRIYAFVYVWMFIVQCLLSQTCTLVHSTANIIYKTQCCRKQNVCEMKTSTRIKKRVEMKEREAAANERTNRQCLLFDISYKVNECVARRWNCIQQHGCWQTAQQATERRHRMNVYYICDYSSTLYINTFEMKAFDAALSVFVRVRLVLVSSLLHLYMILIWAKWIHGLLQSHSTTMEYSSHMHTQT